MKKIFFSLMAFVLFVSGWSFPSEAAEEKTVRVGYMDYTGFIDQQSDATYSGYGAEYLAEIAKHTGYHYEYVYGEWTDLLEMLKNKEIDLLCTAQYTEQRAQIYDFSAYPIGYTQGLLYALPDSPICYEDYTAFDKMAVGIIENSAMLSIFENYEKQHGFSCDIVGFPSEADMLSALEAGKIDAMCSEHLASHQGLSLLAEFGADAYYLMSYKNSPYMSEINYALQEVKTNVDFETNLYHKYYDTSAAATTLKFTSQEQDYIEKCGTLFVGLNANRAPFSEYDEKTGTFSGICVDVLDQIAEKSGLKLEYLPQESGVKTPDLLATGKYDIICGVERDNFVTNETIMATEAFMESSIVPVGKSGINLDMNSSLNAAVPSSFQALQKTLTANYPNLNLTFYKTNRECLDAVVAGDADIFIQNTHILSLLLQEPKYENLDILPVEIMTEHTAMAMLRSSDPMLVSVINKAVANIDPAVISGSLIEHTFASPYKYTAGDFIYKFRLQIALVSALLFLCFVLLIAVIVVRRHNEVKLAKKNVLLADAVAQADRASVAKSEFLSRMSHEIRTPMNAIVGLTTIAKQHEEDPAKIDDYLHKIETSSKVLLNIINDVLDMSAIESNKLKISNTEFDIKTVLTGISTVYYSQCEAKGVAFQMATDLENEILLGDSLRVNQILMNLVSNAFKFTEAGGTIKVYVKEIARKEKTVFLRFTVADTGCGMTPQMQARLFKPFEQETAETAKKHGGSGLGLSIAKNLVDMMHGAIKVTSEKGKGTQFDVDLPFGITDKSTNNMSSESLKNVRILAVDDDNAAREYTAIVLGRIGVKYDIANSGEKALEMIEKAFAEERPYDVCLIDWKMPDMDGIEVTKRIRQLEKKKTLIIIVSAYDLNEVEDTAKAAGADHFVSKPLFQSTLFNVLMTLSNGELKSETAEPENYDFTGKCVLLAEDNEMNAEIATELLSMVKLQVQRAENGQKALEMFQNSVPGTYDAILMDVQMPIMDGYEATKAIRGLEREDAKQIPIFAMTANAFTEDVSAAFSAGMNGHIAKPIDTKALYETLAKAIQNK